MSLVLETYYERQRELFRQERAQVEARTAVGRALLRFADCLASGAESTTSAIPEAANNRANRVSKCITGILLTTLARELADEALGDLDEIYQSDRCKGGKRYADFRYGKALMGLTFRYICLSAVSYAFRLRG
jgi:hypothetical protein